VAKRTKTTEPVVNCQQATQFEKFAKSMRALMAVPKRELDELLAKEKAGKSAKSRLP
jgi:hypothetical protein